MNMLNTKIKITEMKSDLVKATFRIHMALFFCYIFNLIFLVILQNHSHQDKNADTFNVTLLRW